MACTSENKSGDEFDLYLLIERFLSRGPFHTVAKMMREEMSSLEMIPKRRDWKGGVHLQSFAEFQKNYGGIQPDHLLQICTRIAPLLEKYVSTSIFQDSALLNTGRRNSLLRSRESASQTTWGLKHFAASVNGLSLIPPTSLQITNRVYSLQGRELRQSCRRKLLLPVTLYGNMKMCLRCLGHLSSVYCVLFDRTGTKIFTGSDDCLIKCWCVWSGRLLFTFRGHQAEICDMDVSFDNRLLAGGSCNKVIRVWNLQTAAPVAILQGHTATLTSLEFSPCIHGETRYLISTGRDGNVCFWQWNIKTLEFSAQPIKFQERNRPGVSMLCSSWSSGGRFVAVGGSDYSVYIYYIAPELEVPCRLTELTLHADKVDSIWFAHNGLRFASGSCDGTARIWTFEKNEWKSSCLDTSTEKNNDSGSSDKTKIKVVMVAWDCNDKQIFTSLTDFTIKIWKPDNCELRGVLKGHDDDAYCLEGHPTDERILLSAGHDGKVFIWDVCSGTCIMHFYNMLEGQGHGAVFDAKFSPNGDHIVCTDSHGHLLIFSYGNGLAYKKVPEEQFFHTDYRPLIHDSFGSVLDEQTQQAPHRMPPPFLVDVDGNPHPAHLQRLVPGRENLTSESLVPIVAVAENGLQEVLGVNDGNMDDDNIPQPQANISDQQNDVAQPDLASPSRNVAVGLRREGEVAGVRQMHSNAPRSQMASDADLMALGRRTLVTNNLSQFRRLNEKFFKEQGDNEISYYKNEKKNCVKPLLKHKEVKISPIKVTRISTRRVKQSILVSEEDEEDEDIVGEASNDSASSTRLALSRFINKQRHTYGTRSNIARESAESDLELSDEETHERSKSMLSSESSNLHSDSDCSTSVTDDRESWTSPQHSTSILDDNRIGESRTSNKRAQRKKRVRLLSAVSWEQNQSDGGNSNEHTCSSNGSDVEPINIHEIESSKMSLRASFGEQMESPFPIIPGIIPPTEYLPTKWIHQEFPRPSPYLPQIGDEIMYIREGHHLYVKVICEKKVWNIGDVSDICYNQIQLRSVEYCQVDDITFEIGPPTLCNLKLVRLHEDVDDDQKVFSFRFHDMPDVIDFLVLKQQFDLSLQREWKVGDRFRSIIDDAWWYGTIISSSAVDPISHENIFQSLEVEWDSEEIERMSPWDLEPIPDSEIIPTRTRHQEKLQQTCGLPIATEEINEIFRVRQLPSEWWSEPRDLNDDLVELVDREISRIAHAVEVLLNIKMFFQFSGPVDLKVYPTYVLAVPYPIDLTLILLRLQSRYYRRLNALVWDVKMLSSNALAFNKADSKIAKTAQFLESLLLSFISDRECDDINLRLDEISMDNQFFDAKTKETKRYETRKKSTKYPKRVNSKKKILNRVKSSEESEDLPDVDDWKRACTELLTLVWDTEDATPFREGVDEDDYPDYREYVDDPMDLKQIREKLAFGSYESPKAVKDDICLIFKNSKIYNTNKKSKIYSMTIRLQALVFARIDPIITEWQNKKDTFASIMTNRSYSKRKIRKRLQRRVVIKKEETEVNGKNLRAMRSRTLMNLPTENDDEPCSSTSINSKRFETPNIDSDSSSVTTREGREESVVRRSLRKRTRNNALIDDTSDDPETSVVKKPKQEQEHTFNLSSPVVGFPSSNEKQKSTFSNTYEYDPDFNDREIPAQSDHCEDVADSPFSNGSSDTSSDENEESNFQTHSKFTSVRSSKRTIKKIACFVEDEFEENDEISDDAADSHDIKLPRLRSRRILEKQKPLRKSSRTNGRRNAVYNQTYSELSDHDSDELSDHVTSVSSRGRIRRMSTKAMESRIC